MSPLQMRRRREPREVEGFDRGHTAGLHNAASRVAIISLAAAVSAHSHPANAHLHLQPHPPCCLLPPLSAPTPLPLADLHFLTPPDPEVNPRILHFQSQFKTHLQEDLPDSELVNHVQEQTVAC